MTVNTLKGRSAVITGGMTGQGLAIANRLSSEGVNLALGSYLGEGGRLNDVAHELERIGSAWDARLARIKRLAEEG